MAFENFRQIKENNNIPGYLERKKLEKADFQEKIESETKPCNILDIYFNTVRQKPFFSRKERTHIKELVIKKLSSVDASYEDWQIAFDRLSLRANEIEIRKAIVAKMVASAKTFNHWRGVLAKYAAGKDYSMQALRSMAALAESEEEVEIVKSLQEKNYSKFDYSI